MKLFANYKKIFGNKSNLEINTLMQFPFSFEQETVNQPECFVHRIQRIRASQSEHSFQVFLHIRLLKIFQSLIKSCDICREFCCPCAQVISMFNNISTNIRNIQKSSCFCKYCLCFNYLHKYILYKLQLILCNYYSKCTKHYQYGIKSRGLFNEKL